MKKIVMLMVLLSILIASFAGAEEQPVLPQVAQEEGQDLQLDPTVIENHQAMVRAFSQENTLSKRDLTRSVESFHITYETLSNGVFCHVAWYADGYIITALNGYSSGKQVIVINGDTVSISYVMDTMSDSFVHYHTWCTVYSFPNRQLVINF